MIALCKRVREHLYQDLPGIQARMSSNPARLNLDKMARLGLADGADILVSSPDGALRAQVRPDVSVRSQFVSITHVGKERRWL
jgi:hypothetical protein